MVRDSPTTGRREGISALARRLRVQGIIAEAARLRVLLDPMGVIPFSFE
jgi:hypothetical protein